MRESILSVGIDIGTSTTQLVFSSILIENIASQFSVPRIEVKEKRVIYRSPIYFTPLIDQETIDGQKIREIIEAEYKKAGFSPEEVSTGAVIITGETARKENASLVLESLSGLAGEFVVATAGPDLESIIAGKGAGTERFSRDEECTAVNLDIGGGTTNIAVFKNGQVIDTACLDIGGRLIRLAKDNSGIEYIAPKVKRLTERMSIDIRKGERLTVGKAEIICKEMTKALEEVLGLRPKSELLEMMLTGKDLKRNYSIDYVTFSGGVADFIYNSTDNNVFRFNDIGILLGKAISQSDITRRLKMKKLNETIRATVVGAGAHTVEISGSTITYTKNCFPLKNIPILKVHNEPEDIESLAENIRSIIELYNLQSGGQQMALALKGVKNPKYSQLVAIAESIVRGIGEYLKTQEYLIVVVENDIAKALGQTLYQMLHREKDVVSIDGISVGNGDYIDIGKPLGDGRVVPVVIKTLIFNF
ncbi:ethanolamine ammonia-lyase reactivating factor EutA [Lutispora thermophila]|uniref:Reactivating factor of Adenosylcobalamin-dependent ethanolamine ammonia lyase n=1 Tax=Lutispora thermophila DSM 19022 TaxID=1122184 RepID=A0A1M6FID0_9FIRM|nr:ethanolamine ammonia-lyase reactivating factor EutA [Lutispora thermophila]SHI97481.1 Reactivating factor of Adenosylcobalamin-dependent ethanolamine ammonia lyase [Lutispora thermophila DSM 19022]